MRETLLNSMAMEKAGSIELVEAWKKTHSNQLLNEIIKRHEFLIKKILSFYQSYNIDKNTLFIEGTMGLITSLEKFDTTRETRFSTYSYFWIKHFIQKYVFKVNVLVDEISDMLPGPTQVTTNSDSFHEIYEDLEASYHKALNVALHFLNNLERKIFDLRYKEKLTLKEVGQQLHLSGERIRQIEKRIINKLREHVISYAESISGNLNTAIAVALFSFVRTFTQLLFCNSLIIHLVVGIVNKLELLQLIRNEFGFI